MKQLVQVYRNGRLEIVDLPLPRPQPGQVLVRTAASLVSVGTEKYMLELARKSLLGKALARPDLVRQVIAKAQTEGIMEAWRQTMSRLDAPVPLGYSSAGVVIDVGPGVDSLAVGDRVACTGSSYAGHTEVACVPVNLCVKVPQNLSFESAAFAAIGGIALEAVRMAEVSLGEIVVVIGLGLLGQIAVQILNAAGCHVIGMDPELPKAEMALQHGAEAATSDYRTLSAICRQRTGGHGADAVIILAATPSNQPLEQAATLCRERGRIVATGLVGLDIPRKPFYEKELALIVSRAWGPGLYDPRYTDKSVDYPLAYARWTAKRNLEEFLALMSKGAVRVDHLITHRFPFQCATEAYELVLKRKEPYIGVLLTYPEEPDLRDRIDLRPNVAKEKCNTAHSPAISIGLIGAGQFATGTLLPVIRNLKGLRLRGVASSTGLSARSVASKFGFEYCTTDHRMIIEDPEIALVFILTRHGSHARLVIEALRAGKHVFVEKPLALNLEQLQEIVTVYNEINQGEAEPRILMVGFNRRFSPFTRWLKEHFTDISEPLVVHCTVNAGLIPPDHWTYDPEQGGGRIIGEICHFIDLAQYLTDSLPVRVYAETMTEGGRRPDDNIVITLKMANGSISSINYIAEGDKSYPRERVEVFGGQSVGIIENFKAAIFVRDGRKQHIGNWFSVDRGYRGEIEALLSSIRNSGPAPVGFTEYLCTTLATFAIEESLRRRRPVEIDLSTLSS